MAINSCTINGFTLNGIRCRDKFAALIPILHPNSVPGLGAWFQGREDREESKILPTELDRVTVDVTFQGVFGSATQNVIQHMDLVTVTDIHVHHVNISVNIDNLRIN